MATATMEEKLEDKKEAARRALSGAEWTAKRENADKAKVASEQKSTLETELAGLNQQKEKLELAWIELDNQRQAIRDTLAPILAEEKKLEAAEAELEVKEASTIDMAERQQAEKARGELQLKRQSLEQKKWTEEDKIKQMDEAVNNHTKTYRSLLEQEEKLETELSGLTGLSPNGS